MTKPPIIGITTHGLNDRGSFHLPAAYINCVRNAGGIPLLIPPGESELAKLVTTLDGFVFTGGGDIDPKLYGGIGHQSIYGVDTSRDTMELELARQILEHNLPTLAICRGLQVFAVAMGGTLQADILADPPGEIVHRKPKFKPILHAVNIGNPTRLSRILGSGEITCASFHHQAVLQLPVGTKAAALAGDGIIEAFESDQHDQLVAVQWHPEITAAEDRLQQTLFEDLVTKARKFKIERRR